MVYYNWVDLNMIFWHLNHQILIVLYNSVFIWYSNIRLTKSGLYMSVIFIFNFF